MSPTAVLASVEGRDGVLYRIHLVFHREDPRVFLRADDDLGPEDVDALWSKLARFDRASRRGPWTEAFLQLLCTHPGVRASELAAELETNGRRPTSESSRLSG